MPRYFTMVLKLEPGEQVKQAMKVVEEIHGVKFCAGSWTHAIEDRDAFIDVLEDIASGEHQGNADLAKAVLKKRAV